MSLLRRVVSLTAALWLIAVGCRAAPATSWHRETFGATGMTAEIPAPAVASPPADMGTTLQTQYVVKLPIAQLTFFSVIAKNGEYSLDGGVRGVVRRFEKLAAAKGGQVTTSVAAQVERGGKTGRSISGLMSAGDKQMRFQLLMFAEGQKAWAALTVHNDGDAEGQAIAVRVLKSFSIN